MIKLEGKILSKSELLEKRLKNYSKNDTVKLEILRQICKENIDVNNVKLASFSKAMLELCVVLENVEGRADALNFLGIVEDIEGRYSKALSYYRTALELVKNNQNSKTIGSITNNIGLIQWKLGDLNGALDSFFKALKYAEKMSSTKLQASISSNIGLVFQDLKRYKESLTWQKKALSFRLKLDDDYGLGSTYTNLAASFSFLKKSDSVFYYQNKAIELQEEIEDDYGLGFSFQNLASEFKSNKNYTEALKYYFKGKNIREKIKDSLGLSFTYMSIANNFKEMGRNREAINYGEKALQIAKNLKSDERIAENSRSLSAIYRKNGVLDKAMDLQEQYLKYHEKIFDDEMNDKVANLNIKYETEKKEKKIAKSNLLIKESELSSRKKNIWLLLLISAILIGLLLFRNFKSKSKLLQKQLALENNLILEQSNSKIQEQRLEISRDLHDSMGAHLTFMSATLDGLKMQSIQLDDKVQTKINSLSGFVDNSIFELKNTLWLLNSEILFLEDFRLKLLNFINKAAEAQEHIDIKFNFEITENVKIESKFAANMFRIFQEIINNALKYSQAKKIVIDVKQEAKLLLIQIIDDGIGFDFEDKINSSFGLSHIQSRVDELKGTLELKTSSGKGTNYLIRIALKND